MPLTSVPIGEISNWRMKFFMKPTARKDNLKVTRDTGELFIEDLTNEQEIYLNPTSAYVWEKCDGKKDVGEIAMEMQRELGMTVSEKVVSLALSRLTKSSLLEPEFA